MFKIFGTRFGSTFEQHFSSWKEANDKAVWLTGHGYTVEIAHTRTRS